MLESLIYVTPKIKVLLDPILHEQLYINNSKNTNHKYISLIRTDHYHFKLSNDIQFQKNIHLFFSKLEHFAKIVIKLSILDLWQSFEYVFPSCMFSLLLYIDESYLAFNIKTQEN